MLLGRRRRAQSEIPTASLADIAFLLLIFFLVTTTIDTEKGLDLVLPPAQTEEIKIPKKNITNLLINANGQVLLDNKEVQISEITRIIREKLLENDKLIVSVKTDRKTRYEVYIKVLDQLKKANAKRISIAEPEQT